MSAKIKLAKNSSDGRIIHIDEINKKEANNLICFGCGCKMLPVKTVARLKDWHFRHEIESSCKGARNTALHDYAVQVLMESIYIKLSKNLLIEYFNPRKEVSFFGKRSDVTVKYLDEDIHFEIVVTHDLGEEKIAVCKKSKIKLIRIDLSNPNFLIASREEIKELILNQFYNKSFIYWDGCEEHQKESSGQDIFSNLLILSAVVIGLKYFLQLFFKPEIKIRRKRNFYEQTRYRNEIYYGKKYFRA